MSDPGVDRRVDPLTGEMVVVNAGRQTRPNLPASGCPFCRAASRRPSPTTCGCSPTAGRRSPTSAARSSSTRPTTTRRSGSLRPARARRVVDLWAERTRALGARDDVAYVLVFENRGAEVGRHHRPPARPDLRLRRACRRSPPRELAGRRRAALCADAPGARLGRSTRRLAGRGCPTPPSGPTSCCVAPADARPRPPVARRRPTATALGRGPRRRRSVGSTGCSTSRCPTCSGSTSGPTDGGDWPAAHAPRPRRPAPPGARGLSGSSPPPSSGSGHLLQPGRPTDAAAALRAAAASAPSVTTPRRHDGGAGLRPRSGQPHRRPHRLHRRARAADGDRPRHHRRRRRGGDRVALRSADEPEPAVVPLDVDDPAAVSPAWARYVAGVVAEVRPPEGWSATVTHHAAHRRRAVLVGGARGRRRPGPRRLDGAALELALACQRAEQAASGVPCGVMDQLASAAGVAGHALLIDCRSLERHPVPVPDDVEVVVVTSGEARSWPTSAYAERRAGVRRAPRP